MIKRTEGHGALRWFDAGEVDGLFGVQVCHADPRGDDLVAVLDLVVIDFEGGIGEVSAWSLVRGRVRVVIEPLGTQLALPTQRSP